MGNMEDERASSRRVGGINQADVLSPARDLESVF